MTSLQLIISPDGSLWDLNFDVLPIPPDYPHDFVKSSTANDLAKRLSVVSGATNAARRARAGRASSLSGVSPSVNGTGYANGSQSPSVLNGRNSSVMSPSMMNRLASLSPEPLPPLRPSSPTARSVDPTSSGFEISVYVLP